VLPLIIAARITGDMLKRIFGLLTAICVGVLNWGNIGIAAGNFDKAATILQKAYGDVSGLTLLANPA
jgi:hypothetical protein